MTSQSTILLIEDEPIVRMGTAAMLEDAGYQVIEAGDAREALGLLCSHAEIGVVLTDVEMPGAMDGLALVEIIRIDYPDVKSIITSGRTGLPEARRSGASGFLAKPYTATSLAAALKEALVK